MAYRKAAKTEHPFKVIGEMLKNKEVKSPLFFYGRESYLIHWAVQSITKAFVDPALQELNFSKFKGEDMNLTALRNQCETLPLMAEKRVVVVEGFLPLEGKQLKGFNEEEEESLVDYLLHLPDTCILIFTAVGADKRRRLYKTISKAGGCYDFCELDEKLLKGFINKRLKSAGKKVAPDAVEALIRTCGYYGRETDYTLYNLENDVQKAIAHCEGDTILERDFLGTAAGNVETDVFAMLDSMTAKRKGDAFRLLNNMLWMGESEYRIIALICSQLEIILTVKEMREEGMSYPDICTAMSIHEYRVKKASGPASRHSVEELRKALLRALQVDRQIKTGALDGKLALEMLIAEM